MRSASGPLILMAWLSPTFPVGSFAYSHGLEWAVETGDIRDEASLAAWLGDVLEQGAGRNDMILAANAHGAAADAAALAAVNELALALAPSRELHLETSQQGRSFLDATLAAWPCDALAAIGAALPGQVAFPVAVGASAAAHGMPRYDTLSAYGLAFVQNLVSAALRCAPIGQGAGTRVVAALAPRIAALARIVEDLDLDAIGSATLRVDLGSFRHETQYSRIFRS
ncbi:urease accessory protein UreF [Methylobacterium brachythecii]|uniref:Urease accessory protein UreF n=1 Tax=Methylobacterium brachythecii TaxID=1176177 RepID=A0A7W6F7B2_9HYPH|nr:urease accessory protein UreF [Methylobacterium brachythecii]MBB3903198.1 urease accessory protein [Methylobacterium brachythecii]GLS45978.1 urease accessory protein UreF [Methylobacterium brachythecii]